MRTSSPVFSKNSFTETIDVHHGAKMTYEGTMQKTFLLLILVVLTASYVWGQFMSGMNVTGWLIGGVVGGLVFALITIFNKKAAMYTAPAYALAEGLVLGGLSAIFESMYPGIVFQAVLATFGVFLLMLFLYKNRIIRVSEKFTKILLFAIGGVMVVYLVGFIVSFFGTSFAIFGSGPIGIAFTAVVAGIAAFSLLLDFAFIEESVKHKVPKYMEWYAGFGLLVTLIWLYIEILKLLAKLRDN